MPRKRRKIDVKAKKKVPDHTTGKFHDKFTRKNKRIIYDAIRAGLPRSKCADLIGVRETTFNSWVLKAKENPSTPYGSFYKKICELKVAREREALDIISKCGKGEFVKTDTTIKKNADGQIEVTKRTTQMYPQWQAQAWFLERRSPKDYSLKKDVIEKTPEEIAREIRESYNAIVNSVPDKPEPWCNRYPEEEE